MKKFLALLSLLLPLTLSATNYTVQKDASDNLIGNLSINTSILEIKTGGTLQVDVGASLIFQPGTINWTAIYGTPFTVNAVGFSITAGTTAKTLKIDNTLELSGTDGTHFTMPTASDTLVGIAATQTLTNKSIDGGEINSGTVLAARLGQINLAATGNGGVSGLLQAASMPAFTGDVTKASGSLATTVTGINSTTLSSLATGLYLWTAGVPSHLTVGTGLTLAGSTLTAAGSGGTVTSITVTTPTGLLVNAGSTATISSSGTFALTYSSTTGTGASVFANSPTFVTPVLGTVAAGSILTNATGLPISTGVSGLATGAATFLATPTSANLLALLNGSSTGTGLNVFGTSPTLTTPVIFATPTANAIVTSTSGGVAQLTAATMALNGNTLTFAGLGTVVDNAAGQLTISSSSANVVVNAGGGGSQVQFDAGGTKVAGASGVGLFTGNINPTSSGQNTLQINATNAASAVSVATNFGARIQTVGTQTGAADFYGLVVDDTGAFGSGVHRIISARLGGVDKWFVDATGSVTQAGNIVQAGSLTTTGVSNASGTGTNPSYVFTSFLTTGLYAANPGIGFTVAALSVGTWASGNLNVTAPNGTNTAISITQQGGTSKMQMDGGTNALSFYVSGATPAALVFSPTSATATFTGNNTNSVVAASNYGAGILSTINQTSVANFTAFKIVDIETALGSGNQYAIDVLTGSTGTTDVFHLDHSGNVTQAGTLTSTNSGTSTFAGQVLNAQGGAAVTAFQSTSTATSGFEQSGWTINARTLQVGMQGSGGGYVKTTTSDSLLLGTNNITALTLDTSQNATFAGTVTTTGASLASTAPTNGRGTWGLGTVRTGTGLIVSTTSGVQVTIGGTTVTLATITTNP